MTELVEKRTHDSKTYDLGGGQRQLVIGGDIAHYQDDSGNWQDVDLTTADAICPGAFTHCYSKNRLKAYINANAGIIAIGSDKDHYLEIRAHPTNPVAVNVELINKHTIRVYKNTANVHYNFYISDKGLKIDYKLLNSSAPDSFTLGFRLVGLTRQGRKIYKGDNQVGELPNPWIVDANGNQIPVVESINEVTNTATLSYSKASVTAWPAILDPSLTIQPSNVDTYLLEAAPGNNYATSTQLIVVDRAAGYRDRAIIRHDFSALDSGITITNATLTLTIAEVDTGSEDVDVCRLTQTAWVETEANWNVYSTGNSWASAGGDFTTTDKATTTVDATAAIGTTYDWDVTALTQWFQANATEIADWLIKGTNETDPLMRARFASREHATASYRPKLVITYTAGGGSIFGVPITFGTIR